MRLKWMLLPQGRKLFKYLLKLENSGGCGGGWRTGTICLINVKYKSRKWNILQCFLPFHINTLSAFLSFLFPCNLNEREEIRVSSFRNCLSIAPQGNISSFLVSLLQYLSLLWQTAYSFPFSPNVCVQDLFGLPWCKTIFIILKIK